MKDITYYNTQESEQIYVKDLYKKGNESLELNQYNQALDYYQQVTNILPDPNAYYGQSIALHKLGYFHEAQTACMLAMQNHTGKPSKDHYLQLADIMESLGNQHLAYHYRFISEPENRQLLPERYGDMANRLVTKKFIKFFKHYNDQEQVTLFIFQANNIKQEEDMIALSIDNRDYDSQVSLTGESSDSSNTEPDEDYSIVN